MSFVFNFNGFCSPQIQPLRRISCWYDYDPSLELVFGFCQRACFLSALTAKEWWWCCAAACSELELGARNVGAAPVLLFSLLGVPGNVSSQLPEARGKTASLLLWNWGFTPELFTFWYCKVTFFPSAWDPGWFKVCSDEVSSAHSVALFLIMEG